MGIGVSLILLAVGAVLTFAVNASISGLEIGTVGVILMIVGGIGLLLSLMFWSTWGGFGGSPVDRGPAARDRTIVEGERTTV